MLGQLEGFARSIASLSVPGPEPGKMSQVRGKPVPSRTSPSVTSGQSERFCFERP